MAAMVVSMCIEFFLSVMCIVCHPPPNLQRPHRIVSDWNREFWFDLLFSLTIKCLEFPGCSHLESLCQEEVANRQNIE